MTSKTLKLTFLAAAALAASNALADGPAATAIDARGDVHRVQASAAGAEYRFCAAGCSRSGEARVTFALEAPVAHVAVAVGADGRPHALFETRNRVHHAVCDGDCTKPDGWTTTVAVEHAGRYALDADSLAVGPGGAVSFRVAPPAAEGAAPARAFVASCAGGCSDPGHWDVHLDLQPAQGAAAAVAARR